MKFSDAAAGVLTLLFGLAVTAYAWTFPSVPGQQIGPALFPSAIGLGFALLGAALVLSGSRQGGSRPVVLDDWAARPALLVRFLLVIAVLLFYALAVDWLGFFVTAFLFLATLLLAFGVRRQWIAPIAFVVTAVIHYGFYTLLRVPLPWGILEPFAW